MNFYNDNDRKACAWLRELIADGLIPPGVVDNRSILEIKPDDLKAYTQCHFFAGISGWSLALDLARWSPSRPVWTGSCPCQPFSAAGKRKGVRDHRDLWPAFRDLIAVCKPPTVFGEQVASADGRLWLARVRTDVEGMGYTLGAADLCASGIGAPHIRQRLYWVAQSEHAERRPVGCGVGCDGPHARWDEAHGEPGTRGEVRGLAQPDGRDARPERQQRGGEHGQQPQDGGAGGMEYSSGNGRVERGTEPSGGSPEPRCESGGLGHPQRQGLEGHPGHEHDGHQPGREPAGAAGPAAPTGSDGRMPGTAGRDFWGSFDILPCTDGKSRRVEYGTFPLAHGVPGRVGLLRGYGNAIVPPLAAEFIKAFLAAPGSTRRNERNVTRAEAALAGKDKP